MTELDEFINDNEAVKNSKKDWKWEVIRVNCVVVAQGWVCPYCKLIKTEKKCNCIPISAGIVMQAPCRD